MTFFLPHNYPPKIALVTCRRWPTLSPSDRRYATALQALGAQVTARAWNSPDDQAGLREADLVVIRASWDYHDDVASYRRWLAQLQAENIRVLNDVTVVSRFLDKTAFAELAGNEVIVPRSYVCPPDRDAVRRVLITKGWAQAVLKPLNGASGRGVQLVTPTTVDHSLTTVVADVGARNLLVQEFVPEIADGETQFVLFDGKISHAVLKRPRTGEFRTNSVFMPEIELVTNLPSASERIEELVRRLSVQPLYARVDVAMRDMMPVLLEFEVNEPGLWLDLAPPNAADTFARATLDRLR